MSHVDDGMLHAYLDGGLSALDAVRVERHVADCAPCRQRLDGARALIQRAARLLEWASPPVDRAAPPLAALRPMEVPRWRVPLAWAATIVIALGAGIYGGRLLLRGNEVEIANRELDNAAPADQRATPIVAQAPESTPPQQLATQTPPPATPQPAEVASDRLAEATTPTGAGAVAPPDTVAALSRLADAAAAKARSDSTAQLALDARREAQNVAPTGARDSGRVQANEPVAERRAMAPAAAPAAAPTAGFNFRSDRAVTAPITADSARVVLGTAPVSLPEYPVSAIRVRDGVVTVEQVIPPGRVLLLVQRRAAVAEEQERASESLARYVGGLRVEISGPMPPDSLSRLLERARAIP